MPSNRRDNPVTDAVPTSNAISAPPTSKEDRIHTDADGFRYRLVRIQRDHDEGDMRVYLQDQPIVA